MDRASLNEQYPVIEIEVAPLPIHNLSDSEPQALRYDHHRPVRLFQVIYYPGFTLGGVAEPLAAMATLVLVLLMRDRGVAFWWALSAFVALLAMHAIFWLITQPVNRHWLKNRRLGTTGTRFFALDRSSRPTPDAADSNWQHLRNRWEYSHIARALFSKIALIALAVAIAV